MRGNSAPFERFAPCWLARRLALGLVPASATAQGSYSPYDETAAAALARYVRALADDPKDFGR